MNKTGGNDAENNKIAARGNDVAITNKEAITKTIGVEIPHATTQGAEKAVRDQELATQGAWLATQNL